MREIILKDLPDQQFSVTMNDRRVTFRVLHNPTTDRYAFDLALDDDFIIRGRKIVAGSDLLKPFNLGLGKLFVLTIRDGALPSRSSFAAGDCLLVCE